MLTVLFFVKINYIHIFKTQKFSYSLYFVSDSSNSPYFLVQEINNVLYPLLHGMTFLYMDRRAYT